MAKKKGSKYEGKIVNNFLIKGVYCNQKNNRYAKLTCVSCQKLQPKDIRIDHLLNGVVSCKFCHTKFIDEENEVRYLKTKWDLIKHKVKNIKCYEHIENEFETFEEFHQYILPKFEKYKAEHNNNLVDMEIGRPNCLGNYSPKNCECQERDYNLKHESRRFKPFLAENIDTGEKVVCWSQSEFARKYNCYVESVGKCLRGKMKTTNGYRFRYLSPRENEWFNQEQIFQVTGILNFDDPL